MRITPFSWLFLIPFCLILSLSIDVVLVYGQCLEDQRALLLQFKGSLKFDTEKSTRLVKWNLDEDCCRWNGVGCDASGHVISLELDGESISSGIENSTSLFNLQYLEKLDLAFNIFNSSPIPSGISSLKSLVYLNLSNAGFIGQIPIELSKLRKLVVLDLSSFFPGVQQLKLENPNLKDLVQNLTNLEKLYLDSVDISAWGSAWCQAIALSLPKLTELSLRNCKISGPFDVSLSKLHALSFIRLDTNNLSATVPDFIADFPNLRTLGLSFCNLLGTFPKKIFQVLPLQVLDLSNNQYLQGSLPEFPQNGSLRTLALSYTNFTGSIPGSISNLRNLSRIELNHCTFSGPIPHSMENLTRLVYLDFSSNNFTGAIPSFERSKNLSYIDLSRNSLEDSISPAHFRGLSSLANLNLGFNSIKGSIPSSLFALPSLRKLLLSNNNLSGHVDEFPGATSSLLDTLDLSANRLNGLIPKSFFYLRALNVLSLSFNFFTGTVQLETIKNLGNLTRLELSFNNISVDPSNTSTPSALPQLSVLKLASCKLQMFPDLASQSKMSHLDLSDNQIKGEIPNWIWKTGEETLMHVNLSSNLLVGLQKPYTFPSLIVLDLHSNQLQGDIPIPPASAIYVDYSGNKFNRSIPVDIGKNVSYSTTFFSLSNNSLTGSIPESVCNAINLLVLDFSYNALNGKIPSCLVEKIDSLGVLNLARNNFTGSIPDTFSASCSLKTLDFSSNAIEGKIPRSLINCTFLEVLNIGNNNIEDTFPCMLKSSSRLRVLVLRTNKLHGEVTCPRANNSWPQLQIIDIAANNFTGALTPECFSSWKRMMLTDDNAQLPGDHLRYGFLDLNNFYYQDSVTVTIKGFEMELVKILKVFTSIDFSSNRLYGQIPDTIGNLSSLYILNLSHNAFTGNIPSSLGKLSNLGSLDLSVNQLSGEIPATLTSLTFLSFLNLSFNQLSGMIPKGRQFQTFTSASYEENAGLCGYPLSTTCVAPPPTPNTSRPISASEFDWGFIFTGLGLGVGAAIVFAHLAFCKKVGSWFDEQLYKIFLVLFPSHRISVIRYDDGNVLLEESFEDKSLEDTEDFDEDIISDASFQGRYCVFCTKLDANRMKAKHNLKCTCHDSPPIFSSTPTSSSSCSLLYMYH